METGDFHQRVSFEEAILPHGYQISLILGLSKGLGGWQAGFGLLDLFHSVFGTGLLLRQQVPMVFGESSMKKSHVTIGSWCRSFFCLLWIGIFAVINIFYLRSRMNLLLRCATSTSVFSCRIQKSFSLYNIDDIIVDQKLYELFLPADTSALVRNE